MAPKRPHSEVTVADTAGQKSTKNKEDEGKNSTTTTNIVDQKEEEDSASDYSTSESESDSDKSNDDDDDDEEGDEDEGDIVNVDFDFFDPKESDFHSIKKLLEAMFDEDSPEFNLSELSDIIVNQPEVGTTVKAADEEDDIYAFLSVVNLNAHKDKQVVKQIKHYLLEKIKRHSSAKGSAATANSKKEDLTAFEEIMNGRDQNKGDIGLLINERFVNMPPTIVPPLLKLFFEEVGWAVEDKKPFKFEWYLLISPIYKEVISSNADGDDEKEESTESDTTFYFHAEDELIEPLVNYKFDYKLSRNNRQSEARSIFFESGIKPYRRCFVIHQSKLKPIYEVLKRALGTEDGQ
ncbi:Mss4p nuclear export [Mycoemilia scoparia]|uniref:Mss4p nuclear export n=1 Tax=Mycoemilia scoparia TaxID=417184 RepID=A0A9W8DTW1_9FUNG|nr:Mss4p nuclear export [Mycoemilia scoparia]